MQDKIVLISGANSGIGKASALELAKKGAHVVMLCRSQERGQAAMQEIINESGNPKVDLMLCDLASQDSIKEFGKLFRENYDHLDVLLNNAGGIFGKRKLSPDGLEYTFALNHMGYFLLTHELMSSLKLGEMKRIVNVSSLAHQFVRQFDWGNAQGERSYSQLYNYGLSKLFNIYFTKSLAKKYKAEGITANSLHPGTINTGFGDTAAGFFKRLVNVGRRFLTSAEKGARTSVYLASDPAIGEVSGAYYRNRKLATPSKLARDESKADQLWEISMQLAKLDVYGLVE
jgi:NAD(P)-dependent dehydrogenase (short-subunit alcohol dehydrogenase family)